jgi:hypothetical protein
MKLNIFTIFDVKAHAYITPFYLPTIAMATRTFADCINSDTHQFGKHPSDYILFHVGEFDDNKGKHILLPTLNPLGNGTDFLTKITVPTITENTDEK